MLRVGAACHELAHELGWEEPPERGAGTVAVDLRRRKGFHRMKMVAAAAATAMQAKEQAAAEVGAQIERQGAAG